MYVLKRDWATIPGITIVGCGGTAVLSPKGCAGCSTPR